MQMTPQDQQLRLNCLVMALEKAPLSEAIVEAERMFKYIKEGKTQDEKLIS